MPEEEAEVQVDSAFTDEQVELAEQLGGVEPEEADTDVEGSEAETASIETVDTPTEETPVEEVVEAAEADIEPSEAVEAVPEEAQEEASPAEVPVDEPVEAKAEEIKPVEAVKPAEVELSEIGAVRQELASLAQQLAEAKAQVAQDKQQAEMPATEVTAVEFVKDEDDINAMLADPAEFNARMNQMVQHGVQESLKAALVQIPAAMMPSVARQFQLHDLRRQFYEANPDLNDMKDFVQIVANQVAAENPEAEYTQIFDKTAQVVRAKLKMNPAAQAAAKDTSVVPAARASKAKPAFAGKSGARQPAAAELPSDVSEFDKIIQDIAGLPPTRL